MKISYFGWIKEKLDTNSDYLSSNQPLSVSALLENLSQKGSAYSSVLADKKAFCVAHNSILIDADQNPNHMIMPGDEITLFPPISGG